MHKDAHIDIHALQRVYLFVQSNTILCRWICFTFPLLGGRRIKASPEEQPSKRRYRPHHKGSDTCVGLIVEPISGLNCCEKISWSSGFSAVNRSLHKILLMTAAGDKAKTFR